MNRRLAGRRSPGGEYTIIGDESSRQGGVLRREGRGRDRRE
jgi:hypothetical protein